MDNINTTEHWDKRYQPTPKQIRKWKRAGESHILTLLPLLSISPDYTGSILDFGCGMGFGTVCLKRAFPLAEIIGVDHSERGIEFCRRTYPTGIIWQQSSWENCPAADIIICSHIMEHLDNDKEIVRELLKKCRQMFVAVPYKEDAKTRIAEHVNSYDETYYGDTAGFDSAHIVKLPPPPTPFYLYCQSYGKKYISCCAKYFRKGHTIGRGKLSSYSKHRSNPRIYCRLSAALNIRDCLTFFSGVGGFLTCRSVPVGCF